MHMNFKTNIQVYLKLIKFIPFCCGFYGKFPECFITNFFNLIMALSVSFMQVMYESGGLSGMKDTLTHKYILILKEK